MKKCPYCAEEIQDEAIKCKHCGEMLRAAVGAPPASPTTVKSGHPVITATGILLLLIGLVIATYFLVFYDTGVAVPVKNVMGYNVGGGKVHNVGLMQNKQSGIIVGIVVAAAGLACLLIGLLSGGGSATKQPMSVKLPSVRTVFYLLLSMGVLLVIGRGCYLIAKFNQESRQGR